MAILLGTRSDYEQHRSESCAKLRAVMCNTSLRYMVPKTSWKCDVVYAMSDVFARCCSVRRKHRPFVAIRGQEKQHDGAGEYGKIVCINRWRTFNDGFAAGQNPPHESARRLSRGLL
jgi:hypothetical protein